MYLLSGTLHTAGNRDFYLMEERNIFATTSGSGLPFKMFFLRFNTINLINLTVYRNSNGIFLFWTNVSFVSFALELPNNSIAVL